MAAAPSPSSLVKLTVNVVRNLYEKFLEVAKRRHINETEALQQALVIYTFIDERLEHGERFLIADREGRQLREVFFDRIGKEAPPELPRSRLRKVLDQLEEIYRGSR